MALLKFNEQEMVLNIQVEALEEYKSTDLEKNLNNRVKNLKAEMIKLESEYQENLKRNILPELHAIREEVQRVNEKRYPELKKIQEPISN